MDASATSERTEQEEFWSGSFGHDYMARNNSDHMLANNLRVFSNILRNTGYLGSVLELGANVGMNLRALSLLFPGQEQYAVEINPSASEVLRALLGRDQVFEGSVREFSAHRKWELVLIKGVLIHLNPDSLEETYRILAGASGRYVLISEYYNPEPVSVTYRGHKDRLYKRDFAGEFLDANRDFRLVDYRFDYRREYPGLNDDMTTFLLERSA
jgi:pseudaminic acid biosynthesis-associated methylase